MEDSKENSDVDLSELANKKHEPWLCENVSKLLDSQTSEENPDTDTDTELKSKGNTLRNRFEIFENKELLPEIKRREPSKSRGKYTKVSDEYVFESMPDEDLWTDIEKNKNEISKSMRICFEPNCTNPRCNNIFITFTNKKVGSTSLWGSVNLYLSELYTTTHLHSDHSLEMCGLYQITIKQMLQVFDKYNKNVVVVDIYRPIFDICLSNFFNSFSSYFVREFDKDNKTDMRIIMNKFNDVFISLYEKYNVDYYREVLQLDSELNTFNFQDKHISFKEQNINYLKIRLCDSEEWATIVNPFLVKDFKVVQHNETENKYMGDLYKEFKKQYRIPKNYYDIISKNIQFLFYYTEEEQSKYLEKFVPNISDYEYIPYTFREIQLYTKCISENTKDNIGKSIDGMSTNSPFVNNCICEMCKLEKKIYLDLQDIVTEINFTYLNM